MKSGKNKMGESTEMTVFKNIMLACLSVIALAVTYFIVSFVIEAQRIMIRARKDALKEYEDNRGA